MDNLFDILRNAQNGEAIDNIARQFELSQQQAQAAVEALLPAFSLGLKRQVETAKAEPAPPPTFFGLAGAPQSDAFQSAALAFNQQAMQQGQQIMAALFGSNEMSRALSQQAAMQSGVAAPVLAAMMPTLASILVSGLARAAQPQSANPMGEMIGTMMRAFQPAPTPPPAPDGGLMAALWAPFLGTPAPEPKKPEPADMVSQLLETGNQVHKAQTEAMQSLFDAWFGKK